MTRGPATARAAWVAAGVALGGVLAGAPARGHGRLPESKAIAPHPDDAAALLVATTFGLVTSADGGAHWYWVCDEAVGYDDARLDPAIALTPGGAWLVGSFDGLRRSEDGGCSWAPVGGEPGTLWVLSLAVGADGAIWATSGTGARANDVFVSRDDGASFAGTGLAADDTYWKAVAVAPSDPLRVYATGVRIEPVPGGGGTTVQIPLAMRSDDGGGTWAPLPHAFAEGAQLRVLGVRAGDPQVVLVREDGVDLDRLWRSGDGGDSFTQVLEVPENLGAFAALQGGSLLAGTRLSGVFRSQDGGLTWLPDDAPPRLGCAGVGPDGTLYGCGADDAPDYFAIGRWGGAGASPPWSPVFEFEQLLAPLVCPGGTPTHDACEPRWSLIEDLLGIAPPDAGPGADAGAPDAGPGGGGDGGGSCGCGVGLAWIFVAWPRRRA